MLRNGVQIFDLRQKARALVAFRSLVGFEGFNLLGASLNGIAFGVPIPVRMSRLHHSDVIEEKPHASGLAKLARFEEIANLRRRSITIIRQAFHYYRHFVGSETF